MIQRREGKEVNARWKDRMEMEGRRKREEVAKKVLCRLLLLSRILAFWIFSLSLASLTRGSKNLWDKNHGWKEITCLKSYIYDQGWAFWFGLPLVLLPPLYFSNTALLLSTPFWGHGRTTTASLSVYTVPSQEWHCRKKPLPAWTIHAQGISNLLYKCWFMH